MSRARKSRSRYRSRYPRASEKRSSNKDKLLYEQAREEFRLELRDSSHESWSLDETLSYLIDLRSKWIRRLSELQLEEDELAKLVYRLKSEPDQLVRHHKGRDFGLWLRTYDSALAHEALRVRKKDDVLFTILCVRPGCENERRRWAIYCAMHDDFQGPVAAMLRLAKLKSRVGDASLIESQRIESDLKYGTDLKLEYERVNILRRRKEKKIEVVTAEINKTEKLLRKGQSQPIDMALRLRVMRQSNYECANCAIDLGEVASEIVMKTPLSLGGTNDETNMLALCSKCAPKN